MCKAEKLDGYLSFAKEFAQRAGEIMLKYFNAKGISKYKGDRSIVTWRTWKSILC
ncbi:MAG: hypothetical protein FWC00_05495 [Firmicutes bacterium]|nr:hypothetical protein [Bacillota bacterium]